MTALALALGLAFCFALAFPPFSLWPLIFLAPLLLGLLARMPGGWKQPTLMLFLAGTALFLFEHRWQFHVSAVGYPIGAAIMGGYLVAPLLILRFLVRYLPRAPMVLLLPLIWTAVEIARGEYLLGGYAFFLIAHPTIGWPVYAQSADLLGTYFVSFLTAMPAGAVLDLLTRSHPCRICRYAPLVLVAALMLLASLYGREQLRDTPTPVTGESFRLAAVQTNVPQSNKLDWTFEQAEADYLRALELTAEAAMPMQAETPDLIIWPETMLPVGFGLNAEAVAAMRRHDLVGAAFADDIVQVQATLGVPFVIGALASEGLVISANPQRPTELHHSLDAMYNSAFLIQGGAVDERRYDKLYLTPFGETIPYLSRIAWLERLVLAVGAGGMTFDLSPGSEPIVLEAKLPEGRTLRLATPICFEVTSANVCRRLVFGPGGQKRADVLLNLTNDGWFGRARGGREQHLQAARFRTIELRTPMLRSANTGISAAIDSAGRLIAVGPDERERTWDVDGVLTAEVALDQRRTVYAHLGGVFEALVLLLTLGLIMRSAYCARKEARLCATDERESPSSASRSSSD